MANSKHYCPNCGIGILKCTNTKAVKQFGKHTLTYSRNSSWECSECNAYFKLYTPISKLVKAVKNIIKNYKNKKCTTCSSNNIS